MWEYKTDWCVWSVSITPDGRYIVAGSGDNYENDYYDSYDSYNYGCIYLFNTKGELLWDYEINGEVCSVSITPEGEHIVAGSKTHYEKGYYNNYDIYRTYNPISIKNYGYIYLFLHCP